MATVSFSAGELFFSFQPLRDGGFLLARVLENENARPWLRILRDDVWQGIHMPPGFIDLWDAVASPDGQWIAYIAERGDRTNVIETISRDGTRHNVIHEGGVELSKWDEISTARQWAGNHIMRRPGGDRLYYREHSSRGMDVHASSRFLPGQQLRSDPHGRLLARSCSFQSGRAETRQSRRGIASSVKTAKQTKTVPFSFRRISSDHEDYSRILDELRE